MPKVGVEPTRVLSPADFESAASAISPLRLVERSFYTIGMSKKAARKALKQSERLKSGAIRVLVTGFDPFYNNETNPSQQVVEALPNFLEVPEMETRVTLTRLVLPSCCESWDIINNQLDSTAYKTTLVIMLGLANKRDRISLERVALNVQDYRIPDNKGHQWEHNRIKKKAPMALETETDVCTLKTMLEEHGYPAEVSYHAGTFICNDVYFRVLNKQRKREDLATVLFVHLPTTETFAKTISQQRRASTQEKKKAKHLTEAEGLDRMKEAVLFIIENCLKDSNSK